MNSMLGIASSGLAAASLSVEVSAGNIANSLKAARMPQAVAPRALAGGGVQAQVLAPNDAGAESRIDGAIVGLSSGTDPIKEQIAQIGAATAYRANLATLRGADDLMQATVSLTS